MDLVEKYFLEYTVLQASTTEKEVAELEHRMDVTLPEDLKNFLLKSMELRVSLERTISDYVR